MSRRDCEPIHEPEDDRRQVDDVLSQRDAIRERLRREREDREGAEIGDYEPFDAKWGD